MKTEADNYSTTQLPYLIFARTASVF